MACRSAAEFGRFVPEFINTFNSLAGRHGVEFRKEKGGSFRTHLFVLRCRQMQALQPLLLSDLLVERLKARHDKALAWPRVQVPLQQVAAEACDDVALADGLDALGHHGHLEFTTQAQQ